jgi:AcrR family transcriptional regulator
MSRRAERKEATRAELVETAAGVFARRGFHAASIDHIAAEAGYSSGAIYHHFTGKEDLFLAVYERYAATRVRELEALWEGESGPLRETVRAGADHWMRRTGSHPELLVLSLEFLIHAWRHPEVHEAFKHRIAAVREAVGRHLQARADETGIDLPMPANELGTVMRELGTGLAVAKLADPDAIRDDLFGDFLTLLFELIEARPREREREA